MKRCRAALVLFCLLLFGADLEAACNKRLLLYLDRSGSMFKGSNSPYQQTINAIENLLSERDFIQQDDTIEVVLVGTVAEPYPPAIGPDKIRRLVSELRRVERLRGEDDLTDFGVLFQNLEEKLQSSEDFSRQVVIIASDFIHESRNGRITGDYVGDWKSVLNRWGPTLRERFAGGKLPLLVSRAPARFTPPGSRQLGVEIQKIVVDDLKSIVPDAHILDLGGNEREQQLAKDIRVRLLFDPEVTAGRDPENSNQIRIVVRNTNCYPLTVQRIELRCKAEPDLPPEDPVPFTDSEIQPQDRRLEPTGKTGSERSFFVPLPTRGGCWNEAAIFEAVVLMEEGVSGRSEGTTGSHIEYRPRQALLEDHIGLRGKVLRLQLEMKGTYVESDPRDFTVILLEGSNDVARRCFKAPPNLSPDTAKEYTMVFPIPSSRADRIEPGSSLAVNIEGAERTEDHVTVAEDSFNSLTNLMQLLVAVIACGGALVLFMKRRFVEGATFFSFVEGVWQMAIALIPIVANKFRAFLLEALPMGLADFLKWLTIFGVGFFGVLLPLRLWRKDRLEWEVRQRKIKEFSEYRRRVAAGWISMIVAAAVAVLLVVWISLAAQGSKSQPKQIQGANIVDLYPCK